MNNLLLIIVIPYQASIGDSLIFKPELQTLD